LDDRFEGAALGRNQRRLIALHALNTIEHAEFSVLDQLAARFGNREQRRVSALQQQALVVNLGDPRVALDLLVALLWVRAAPSRRVDVHLVALVRLDQRDLSRRELVGILVDVAGVDGEEDLVVRKHIDPLLARLPAGRGLGDASLPLGNRTVGVAGPLCTDGRELGAAETGDLLRG